MEKPDPPWREISLEMDALGSALYKRRNIRGTKVARKVPKESELSKVLEGAANDAEIEDSGCNRIRKTIKQLRQEEEVGEARALLEDMQQTV